MSRKKPLREAFLFRDPSAARALPVLPSTGKPSGEFRRGAEAAAGHASDYDSASVHDHRLGDCILARMNLREAPPRKNRRRLSHPYVACTLGFASALAEVARQPGADLTIVRRVAAEANLTLDVARRAGLLASLVAALRRAGIPTASKSP